MSELLNETNYFSPDPLDGIVIPTNGGFSSEKKLVGTEETVIAQNISPFEMECFSIGDRLILTIQGLIGIEIDSKNDREFGIEIDKTMDLHYLKVLLGKIRTDLCEFNDFIKEIEKERPYLKDYNPCLVSEILKFSCEINRLLRLINNQEIGFEPARKDTEALVNNLLPLEVKLPYESLNRDPAGQLETAKLFHCLGSASPENYAGIDWSKI